LFSELQNVSFGEIPVEVIVNPEAIPDLLPETNLQELLSGFHGDLWLIGYE
jgi:hypothetical protein